MNLPWVQHWLDLFNDVPEMMKFYQPDVHFEDPTWGLDFVGVEKVDAFFAAFSKPGAGHHTFTAHRYIGDEKAGALDWTWYADFEGDFLGYPAAGKHIEMPGVTLFTFKDDLIQTQLDLWDTGPAYRALGVAKPLA